MSAPKDRDDEAREAILARRMRFVKLAVAGVAAATTATACVCLSPPLDNRDSALPRDAGTDAGEDAP
ncbi:MAG: hypothetical protein U0234_06435 [Sandaracinus sp.]